MNSVTKVDKENGSITFPHETFHEVKTSSAIASYDRNVTSNPADFMTSKLITGK